MWGFESKLEFSLIFSKRLIVSKKLISSMWSVFLLLAHVLIFHIVIESCVWLWYTFRLIKKTFNLLKWACRFFKLFLQLHAGDDMHIGQSDLDFLVLYFLPLLGLNSRHVLLESIFFRVFNCLQRKLYAGQIFRFQFQLSVFHSCELFCYAMLNVIKV